MHLKKDMFRFILLKDQKHSPTSPLLHQPSNSYGTYLENYDPGVDNVVKVDGTFVGVTISCVASSVILVPVDAKAHCFTSTATVGQWLRAQAQSLSVERILLV